MGCYFTNDFIKGFEKEYQICSCNRHVWSARSHRVLRARGGKFVLVTREGKRSLHPCTDDASSTSMSTEKIDVPDRNPNIAARLMKTALLAAMYATMMYSPVLLTSLEPMR